MIGSEQVWLGEQKLKDKIHALQVENATLRDQVIKLGSQLYWALSQLPDDMTLGQATSPPSSVSASDQGGLENG